MDSNSSSAYSTGPETPAHSTLPPNEQLPPVQPPSASFIMQLFLVPGLIVAVVVGSMALFGAYGKLFSSELDWRHVVSELRSTNEHRRWRGANALAQVLQADANLGESGQHLSSNEQIAKELATLLDELLKQPTSDPELITHQSFVVRTLGWLDSESIIFPTLINAMQPKNEILIRLDAVEAVAKVAGRKAQTNGSIADKDVIEQVIECSRDENPLMRQVAAFTLGLLPGDDVDQRLKVMISDADTNARTNSAFALARRGATDGVSVMIDVLKTASLKVDVASMPGPSEPEKRNQAVKQQEINGKVLFNTFRAFRELKAKLSDDQRQQALVECERLAKDSEFLRIRMDAGLTVSELKSK